MLYLEMLMIRALPLLAKRVKNPPAKAGDTGEEGQSLGQEDSLEEEMATHSSTLA